VELRRQSVGEINKLQVRNHEQQEKQSENTKVAWVIFFYYFWCHATKRESIPMHALFQ